MSEPNPMFVVRRILVALDTSPHSLAALEAAVNLAAKMNAELLGLFVEDTALLRLAEAPCAREILYFSAAEVPLTRASMESRLRAQSEQAQKALAAAAQRAQIQWSFRTVRGEVASEVLAAASAVDLLAMGKCGWSFDRPLRMGSTALEISASSIPVLLLPESGLPAKARLVVYYDGSPAAKRGLLTALQLEDAGMDGITILLDAENRDHAVLLQDEIATLTQRTAQKVRYRQIDPDDKTSLPQALKAERTGVLVLGGREFLKKLTSLDMFPRETDMSMLLLGDESDARIE
jgi:nucleotide-binding universal stress UspA family protein